MPQRKMKMELIKDVTARAATYQKRKRNLIKKAQELSILCNVDTCLIMYEPPRQVRKSRTPKLETWPSDAAEVRKVINKYKAMPLYMRRKKCSTVFDFLVARQIKVDDEIRKQREANFHARFPTWDDRLDNLSPRQTFALITELDSKIEAAMEKLKMMMKGSNNECLNNGGSKSGSILAAPLGSNQADPPLFQNNLDLEVTSQLQLPLSTGLNPFQMTLPSYYPFAFADAPAMQPFDPNVVDNSVAMLPTNSSDYTQFDGESSYSSSCLTHSSISSQPCYDLPAASMFDNVRFDDPQGVQFCFYEPFMQQPVPPSGQSARPSFSPRLEGLYPDDNDNQQHGSKNNK